MISSKQYGFRPGFTTSDCLIDLIEEIASSLDQGLYVVSLFLDLSNAFDTVSHQILLNKLLERCSTIHKGQTIQNKVQKSTFKLVPCSILMISYLFYNLLSYFVMFSSLFLLKISSSCSHLNFNIGLSRRAPLLSSPSNILCNVI